jgi:hypothetical protein
MAFSNLTISSQIRNLHLDILREKFSAQSRHLLNQAALSTKYSRKSTDQPNKLTQLISTTEIELTPQHPQLLSRRGTEQETEVAHYF